MAVFWKDRLSVKRFFLVGVLIAALAPLACTFCDSLRSSGSDAAASGADGLYVEFGPGSSCWEIERLPGRKPLLLQNGNFRLVNEGDRYVFEHHSLFATDAGADVTKAAKSWVPYCAVKPSDSARGDFDLVALYGLDTSAGMDHPEKWRTTECPLSHPVPSYLHRMTDPRAKKYFLLGEALRTNAGQTGSYYTPATFAANDITTVTMTELILATRMIANAPSDPFARVFYMDALAMRGDAEGLRNEIEQWGPRFEEEPILRGLLRYLEETQVALDLTAAGHNGADFLDVLFAQTPSNDLPTRLETLPGIFKFDEFARPSPPISAVPFPSYLNEQIGLRVFEMEATFSLLQGDGLRALGTSVAEYHLGQLVTQNGVPISRLIGAGFRKIAIQGLEMCVLNGCESPAEVETAWQLLEWLDQREKSQTVNDLMRLEPASAWLGEEEAWKVVGWQPGLGEEALIWQTDADARFQLVRMAASAWHRRLVTGAFPKRAGRFDFFPDGFAPHDPFCDGPLRFVENPSGLVCYSVGPDGRDDGGTLVYDVTNGTKSAGDITLEVPRERKYPFPSGGVKAATKADLLRQFPNGLPPDRFANTRGKPLGVTDTSPVVIYSDGPDMDRSAGKSFGDSYVPEVVYDPTNGTCSRGDLTLTVPGP